MVRYELQRLPGAPRERGVVDAGKQLIDLLDSLKLHNDVVVRLNGRELADDFDISYKLKQGDFVTVFDQPQGGVGKLIQTILKPVTKILSGAMKLLGLSPKSAGSVSVATGDSPNNDVTQQTNRARLYKGRPNIYGQVRAYPDLIQESMFEYVNNNKMVTEWMEIGYGHYDISSVRYSESSLVSMAGASYQIYQPGDVIDEMAQGYAFDDVDGQEIPGLNENDGSVKQSATTSDLLEGNFSGFQFYARISKVNDFDYFYDSPKPLSVTVKVNVTYETASGTVTKDVSVAARLFQSTITDDGGLIDPEEYYNFWFDNLSGSDYSSLPSDTVVNSALFTINEYNSTVIGPFFAALESEQLWVHLYANLGGGYDAPARVTLWQVDEDNNQIAGTEQSVDIPVHNSGGSADYIYVTRKITPTAGYGRYAFSLYRTNNSQSDSVLYLSGAHAVSIRQNVVYPDDTLVRVTVRQTETQTVATDRKYNCLVQRKVISWSAEGGIDYTLRASRSFADAVLHEWVVIGKQDPERMDLPSLYAISDSLSDEWLGYFDWTFSDATQPLGERIQIACNVARVDFNWIGDTLTFWRDEKVTNPDAVFARSNMFWDEYKLAWQMSLPGGYDGVSLDYVDPSTNKKLYIYLQIDSNGITEVEDATVNAMQVSLSGCRNRAQALDRAWLEARKILYSRLTMTVKVLESTQVVRGTVVQCPDLYDNKQQNGYITGRNGDVFYTSERIDFSLGDMWVVMTDSLGNYRGRWRAYPVDDNPKAFEAAADAFDLNIYDRVTVQNASRYFIATNTELNSTIWRVESAKPNGDDTQTLSLSEYSDLIYP
ncbi:host specificity factor TipJ family phage tail protein [Klebsiella sp. 2680]|uniref:host specificity factor TipJ family phage tail protein n=1 Tax=Klebsiella sp. 2680 TaxID=2018037 RepID=UPI00115A1123|nr:host specificity factor TipJ family phage tail protein [Klebsiella sp. 2680]